MNKIIKFIFLLTLFICLIGCSSKKVNITFYNENEVNTIEVDYKTIITNDIISGIDSDNIEGLYLDESYTIKYNNEEIKANTTIYIKLKEVSVTFKYYDREEKVNINRSSILTTDLITIINEDDIEGLYLDESFIIKYNNEEIKEDITIYIKQKEVKVTFKYEDKEEIVNIKRSSIITYDLIKILKEEDIEGLYLDSTYSNKYNNEEIKEDITIYIKQKEVSVTFKYYDREEKVNINRSSILTTDLITIINEDDIEGLYLDESYTIKYNNEEIKEDITLYIKHVPIISEIDLSFISYHELSPKFYSGVGGVPIKYIFSNENIVFESFLSFGSFSRMELINKKFLESSSSQVRYLYLCFNNLLDPAYLDIVVRENNNIIGLVVVKVENYDTHRYLLTTMISVNFPKVNEKYQDVTEEYIKSLIETSKK